MITFSRPLPRHVIAFAAAALLVTLGAACTEDAVESERCPPGVDYDEELDRCDTDDDGGDDAGTIDDTGSQSDTGAVDTGSGDPDTGSGDPDTGSGDPDTGSGDPDTGTTDTGSDDTGSDDTGSDDTGSDDTGSDDTGSGDPDTGSGDPLECGDDLWDDTHDGEDPWEDPLIDCGDLNASWDCDTAEDEQIVLGLINEMRAEEQDCGDGTLRGPVDPVEMNEDLQCAARIHSWDMAGRGFWDHDTPEGVTAGERADLVGAPGTSTGETLAQSWSPSQAVDQWMNSPPHCAIIMGSHYDYAGVGIDSGYYTLKLRGFGFSW